MSDVVPVDPEVVRTALLEQLATLAGGTVPEPADDERGDPPADARWVVQLSASGPARGRVVAVHTAADAVRLVRRRVEGEDTPDDEALRGHLTDIWSEAARVVSERDDLHGTMLSVSSCDAVEDATQPVSWTELAIGDDRVQVGLAVEIESEDAEAEASPDDDAPDERATDVGPTPAPALQVPSNLEVVLDIDLPLAVRFGQTEMSLAALSRIGPGSVIALDRSPDEPVDVLVNGKLVARGEVVVVSGNYGVRVTHVTSAADRIRSLGG